jgi:hypothetical protein
MASIQYAAHLCNIHYITPEDTEFANAMKALSDSWQNFLIFMQEIAMKIKEPGNV